MGRTTRRLRHDLLYGALRAFLAGGGALPLSWLRLAGRASGRLALALATTERRRAVKSLAAAFPELPERDRRKLLRASASHFGATLAEVAFLWNASPRRVGRLFTISGLEHLEKARRAGRGAVLVTGHCGNWELLNAALGLSGIPMTIAVRELYDPRLDRVATRLRARFGTEVVARGHGAGRRLAEALLENRVVGLLIDQDIRDIPGVFVPFFGRPAWTPSGAAMLAINTAAPVVPAFIHRRPDGTHHVAVYPPLPVPAARSRDEAVRELTAAATAAIEAQVRAHPEQWVWMHRRWRTRPAEAAQAGVSAGS